MTKKKQTLRELAESHWKYSSQIATFSDETLLDTNKKYLELMKYFYIEAAVHFYKHAKEEIENRKKNKKKENK